MPAQAYFVTVRVLYQDCALGDINDEAVTLSGMGDAVLKTWEALPACFPGATPDALVVMPNHLHGIFVLPVHDGALETVMRAFKSLSTIACNASMGRAGGRFWQSGYDAQLLETDHDLEEARRYIAADPAHWAEDVENPECCTA